MCFPPVVPLGVDTVTTEDGFIDRNDNWTSWHVSRPFVDEHGAAEWMKTLIARTAVTTESLEPDRLRSEYRIDFERIQRMVGESVICNYSGTGFSMVFDRMGLEIFSYFTHVYPELFGEFMEASAEYEVRVATAVADRALSPVILIPEDFATKQGPIFSPEFLARYHYPDGSRRLGATPELRCSITAMAISGRLSRI